MRVSLLSALFFLTAAACAQTMVEERYPSGQLRAIGEMLDGQKSGKWEYYYPSGELNAVEHFIKNRLHGEVIYYYRSGQTEGIEQWMYGVLLDSAFYYHENGTFFATGFIQMECMMACGSIILTTITLIGKSVTKAECLRARCYNTIGRGFWCNKDFTRMGKSTVNGNFLMTRAAFHFQVSMIMGKG